MSDLRQILNVFGPGEKPELSDLVDLLGYVEMKEMDEVDHQLFAGAGAWAKIGEVVDPNDSEDGVMLVSDGDRVEVHGPKGMLRAFSMETIVEERQE